MSVEEDVELRDLVAQSLELNGCLPKIRAQLRANLFLALDEDSKISKQQPLLNTKVKSYLQVPEGQLMFCLVREFLEHFDLDFTASVYESESYMGGFYKYEGRQKILDDLGLRSDDSLSGPVLLQVVKIAQTKSNTLSINLRNTNEHESNSSAVSSDKVNGHSLSEGEESSHKSKSHTSEELNINPVRNSVNVEENINSTYVKKDVENDDTFNGTSSIEEEIENGNGDVEKAIIGEEEVSHEHDSSPDSKSRSEDRTKSSIKSDKLKSKLELPPLQINKSRGSDLLPSLYNKDFNEKTNKEYDFEIKDDYEEDFMSGSDIEFSQSKIDSPKPLFEELRQCSEYATNKDKSSLTNKSHSNHNSRSDKFVNSNSTDNIETNLSVNGEVSTGYQDT